VILSKALSPRPARPPARTGASRSPRRPVALVGLALVLTVAVVAQLRRPAAIPPAPPLPPSPLSSLDPGAAAEVEEPPLLVAPAATEGLVPPSPTEAEAPARAAEADREAALRLSERRHAEARARLSRGLGSGDWPAAERAARDVLSFLPSDAEAARGLAYALVRQDRSRDAAEGLADFLDRHPDPQGRVLLDRIRREQGSEGALDEARVAHFHVRYDGEEHQDVGREIVRVLDRHYATLAVAFDHQPAAPIPVILLSRESYYDATGAPFWSGGQYDSFDGRVRVPIGGLTAALGGDLEATLLHELTHAFVADISRGAAPRDVQEGLAQLMEGKRAESLLGEDGLRALADGRIQGVTGFYLSSLSFVEYLVAQRGQGGIGDLLRSLAAGSGDPFQQVYGKGHEALRREWLADLRRRHGS
jgi:hypothetical protein